MSIRLIKYIILLILSMLLFACSTFYPAATTQQPVRIGLKLPPATFAKSISLQQHLIVERAGKKNELDAALEITPQQLNVVFLAWGQRIMSMQYDSKQLTIWHNPHLPKQIREQVRGEDILEDLQLSLWSAPVIRKALPAGWRIQDRGKQRLVLFNNKPIIKIDYTKKQRWQGTMVLTNLRYHYRLIIQSVVTEN